MGTYILSHIILPLGICLLFVGDSAQHHTLEKLFAGMRGYFEEAAQKIVTENPKRFHFEHTKEYEMGFVMHEVIEKYRKMTIQYNRSFYHFDMSFDPIEATDNVQKLYFEIYHLVNMMHEIYKKYEIYEKDIKLPEEDKDTRPKDGSGGGPEVTRKPSAAQNEAMAKAAELERKRKEAAREKKKANKALQKIISQGGSTPARPKPGSRTYNLSDIMWPIDYGWEIDGWRW